MQEGKRLLLRAVAIAGVAAASIASQSLRAETIIDEWASIKAPPPRQ